MSRDSSRLDPELTAITERYLEASIEEAQREWRENREWILGWLAPGVSEEVEDAGQD